MRRLYSTFAGGWPGVGLLLMRLVLGITLAASFGQRLVPEPADIQTVVAVPLLVAGILLILGLWTPITGTCVALIEIWSMIMLPGKKCSCLLMATMGAALAMLGPGLWSIDARRYGWKRIETRSSRKKDWSL